MKVIVLGGGVVGTATAYYLARAGAEVTVLERKSGVALETSFANAGQVSPGYSTPWAAPGIPLKAIKWLFQRHAPLAVRADGSLFQLRWMLQMLLNCTSRRYAVNKERMMRLAEYSRDCLRALRAETGIHYEERTGGTLQLLRTDAQMVGIVKDIQVLDECGVPYRLLQQEMLAETEPALARVRHKFSGGLLLPNDETGDCYLFTSRLAALAEQLGAKFYLNTSIDSLLVERGKIKGVLAGDGLLEADRYVLALGCYSRQMLQQLGIDLPVYPVKGYSITVPLQREEYAPQSTILDETYKVAITRFDQRVRIGGMAELGGFDLRLNPRRRETLEMVANDIFPQCGDTGQAEFWTGLRPMTPDSTPVIGVTACSNLFLNTGHGTLGWTMGCGSGKLTADLVLDVKPAIRYDDLALARYQQTTPTTANSRHSAATSV